MNCQYGKDCALQVNWTYSSKWQSEYKVNLAFILSISFSIFCTIISSSGTYRVLILIYICIYCCTNSTMCICIFINWYKNKIMRQLRRHLHKKNGTFKCLLVPFRSYNPDGRANNFNGNWNWMLGSLQVQTCSSSLVVLLDSFLFAVGRDIIFLRTGSFFCCFFFASLPLLLLGNTLSHPYIAHCASK